MWTDTCGEIKEWSARFLTMKRGTEFFDISESFPKFLGASHALSLFLSSNKKVYDFFIICLLTLNIHQILKFISQYLNQKISATPVPSWKLRVSCAKYTPTRTTGPRRLREQLRSIPKTLKSRQKTFKKIYKSKFWNHSKIRLLPPLKDSSGAKVSIWYVTNCWESILLLKESMLNIEQFKI